MSSNLLEFIKVFVVVFGISGCILSVRNLMVNMDEPDEVEDEDIIDVSDAVRVTAPDVMDYDGMGNYGRFPKIEGD